ncbi:hypothetical protein AB0D14_14470 [Streptomyces sp. NPDC048484]|uniref:hypothetical protein n=1 Tax=Streptomyces sp. NPDC048484 TaxID=3155146 RepID=UPI0034286025
MDSRNLFETRTTYALHRAEWLVALGVSVVLALAHLEDIRWPVFVGFFAVIDLVGYLPGAIRFRRSRDGRVPKGYYVAYNTMHSLVTGAVMAGLWAWLVEPEWALLAIPIHLLGDRGLFGNSLKPFGIPFEPATHPAFSDFVGTYTKPEGQGAPNTPEDTPQALATANAHQSERTGRRGPHAVDS